MATVTSLYICISYNYTYPYNFYYLSSLHAYCMSTFFPLPVLCLWHIFYLYFYCIPILLIFLFYNLLHSMYYSYTSHTFVRLILSYTLCFRILFVLFLCWLKANTFISYLYFSYYVNFYLIFHISRRSIRLILLLSYHILSYVFTYAFMCFHILYLSYTFLFYLLYVLYLFISFSCTVLFIYCIHITYYVMPLLCLSFVYMYSFLCFVIFYLSLSFLSFMHFYHVFLACSIIFLSVCLSYIHIIYEFLSCLYLFIYFLYFYHVPSIRLCMTIICSHHIILYSYVPIIRVL